MLQLLRFLALSILLSLVSFCLCDSAQKILSENAKSSNESLLWGPYRPNLYFGVRPRIPKSLVTGLLWAKVDSFQGVQNSMFEELDLSMPVVCLRRIIGNLADSLNDADFRHTCEQHEGMAGYGWDEYDVRQGGRQTIHDAGNSIDITTEFVKLPGGQHGGNWGVRIKGTPRDDAPSRLISTVIFYAGMEGLGNLKVNNFRDDLGVEGPVIMDGSSNELGDFTVEITEGPDSNSHPPPEHISYVDKPLDRSIVTSLQVPEANLWQAKRMWTGTPLHWSE